MYYFRGYFRRGRETDNFLKLLVKVEILDDEGQVKLSNLIQDEEIKKQEERDRIKKIKTKKNVEKKENDNEFEDLIVKELKHLDLFHQTYLNFFINSFYNKKERKNVKKEDIPIPLSNIKVRVYIHRALNLTAQDDSSSLLVKAAGMSAFSKANSFLEIIVGEENAV